MSSSQIFCASSADLPLGPRPPVIAMLKPIVIGWPDWAAAGPATAVAAAAPPSISADLRLRRFTMVMSSGWIFWLIVGGFRGHLLEASQIGYLRLIIGSHRRRPQ